MEPTIEEKLKIYRRRKNITQEEIAERSGVDQPTVSLWESGCSEIPGDLRKRVSGVKLKDFEKLFLLRKRNNININDVARNIGLSRFTIIKAERGDFSDRTFKLLKEYYNVK